MRASVDEQLKLNYKKACLAPEPILKGRKRPTKLSILTVSNF